ncbi:MAG: Uncharacterised protein [Porticoccaceae bacterium UBA1117]|nr:MAG: Uncharacterised protein [Porticoccaceae bacterium UBA1117]
MNNRLLAKENLVIFLGFILVLKFGFLPLLEWQSAQFEELGVKSRKLAKLEQVIAREASYKSKLEALRKNMEANAGFLYENTSNTKLNIQRDVEHLFEKGGLSVTGYTWISDADGLMGGIRTLKSTVYFSGGLSSMVKVFWELASAPKLIRVVQWNQQIQSGREGAVENAATTGGVTLEFLASNEYNSFERVNVAELGE